MHYIGIRINWCKPHVWIYILFEHHKSDHQHNLISNFVGCSDHFPFTHWKFCACWKGDNRHCGQVNENENLNCFAFRPWPIYCTCKFESFFCWGNTLICFVLESSVHLLVNILQVFLNQLSWWICTKFLLCSGYILQGINKGQ